MATITDLKQLAKYAGKKQAPENFTVQDVDRALRDGFKELACNLNQFMKNRYDIYEIMTEAIDEIVPNRVMDSLSAVAEVSVVKEGERKVFKTPIGKSRARKFLTQVGLSGTYETFRLDEQTFEIKPHAVGGATIIDYQRLLDGAELMSDVMEVITEGLIDAVFVEVQKALRAALEAKGRPGNTIVSDSSFDPTKMQQLVNICLSYSKSAVILAPPEFIAAMGADAIVPVGSNYQGVYHPQDIDSIHNTGYINLFRGTPVVRIPQSFTDETNTKTCIDPQLAYVLPGDNKKVVKVVLEGSTQMHDYKNRDASMEIHASRKMGVGILTHYNWCIYQNTSIDQTYDSPFGV